jgi:hypothetical protein
MPKHPAALPAICTVAIAALAWIDPLYLPLIAFGPLVSGVAAGASGVPPRIVALTWLGAGVLVLLTDLAINHEDVAFHAVVATITAAVGAAAGWAGSRRRRRSAMTA